MEPLYVTPANGCAVYSGTIDTMAANAAKADDRILAALHAMTSRGLSRGVIQSGYLGLMGSRGLVQPGHNPGAVDIAPFRAFIKPTPTTADGAWRGVFSGLFCPAVGTDPRTEFLIPVGAAANRWDLICAKVQLSKAATGTTIKRKDPTSGQVTSASYSLSATNDVTLVRVEGTTGAPPALPAVPADVAPYYYIPLAYIRVKLAYNPAADSFGADDIWPCDTLIDLHPQTTGATVLRPASGISAPGGAYFSHMPYTPTTTRPHAVLPTHMMGGESRLIPMCFGGAEASASFASGDIVDNTIDWRNRFFRWYVHAAGANDAIASAPGVVTPTTPSATTSVIGTNVAFGFGQSFVADVAGKAYVAQLSPTNLAAMAGATSIDLYVDTATGELKIDRSVGSPNVQFFFWIDASGQDNV